MKSTKKKAFADEGEGKNTAPLKNEGQGKKKQELG